MIKLSILENGKKKIWEYDNKNNIVYDESGKQKCPKNYIKIVPNSTKYDLSKVTKLSITLGLNCNFNCAYCSEKEIRNKGYNSKVSDVDEFISKIDKITFESLNAVQFFGGETLLYWKVMEKLIPYFRKRFPKIMIWFFTNGELLTNDIINFCKEYNVFVNVSDDGTSNGLRKNESSFELKKKFIRYNEFAKTLGFLFGICLTITKYNCDITYQRRFLKYNIPNLQRIDFDNILRGNETLSITKNEINIFYKSKLNELRMNHQFDSSSIILRNLKESLKNGYPNNEFACGIPLKTTLVLDLKGNIFSCEHNSSLDSKIGNIDEIDDVCIENFLKKKKCEDCIVFGLCGGGCPKLDKVDCDSNFANYFPFYKIAFKDLWGVDIL